MKKIIAYIKNEWKFLLVIIALFLLMTIRLPYQIYGPGGKIDLSDRFTGEEHETSGSFNVTYISSYPGTLPLLGLSYIIPNWDIVKDTDVKYSNETIEEARKRDKIYNDYATSNATYFAYNRAGKEIEIKEKKLYVTYIHPDAKTDLKIGDEIIRVDNSIFKDNEELTNYIRSKAEHDKVEFKVKRDNKEIDCYGELSIINDEVLIGIAFTPINEYENIELKYKSKSNELGPSGGLMMALYMYNSLTEEDISNGKDIYGTGTIESDGSAGEIDGVKYKLIGAYKKGAKYFIVPEANYEEANKIKEERKLDINIISVISFDDAIIQLKELK